MAEAILRRLKTDGPLSTAAFSEHGHAVDWWWAPTRASRAVMEALFVAGRIGIAGARATAATTTSSSGSSPLSCCGGGSRRRTA